jgi:ubiquinone/menaquinone biosynthesis C-methylase UbiE
VNTAESRYIDRTGYYSRYTHEQMRVLREAEVHVQAELDNEAEWRRLTENMPRFIPFLTKNCGLEFRGRILEIGAGAGWFSAELSKIPNVVELVVTDVSRRLLKEKAPQVFKLLNAKTAKITRTPGDFHKLDFPSNHFDFVVCSAALHHATNMVQALRETKRVLKPGGRLVAIREPVWPLLRLESHARRRARPSTGGGHRFYTLSDYKEFFKQASLPVEVKRVNLASGLKYYVNELVNGLTHARYAFIGSKRGESPPRSRRR